ncbi:MAG: hypothetical protein JSU87_16925 [Gemmatimonadota bacterium]|nr:MAG: hypothetical protein JSU87_16925 [Gemmatimonadota bacterium]
MSRRVSRVWSPGLAFGVGALFLLTFFCGGLWLSVAGLEYQVFGLVDGLTAILVLYVLVNTAVLSWPRGAWGAVVFVYAAIATAQLVSLLLPPPGVLEWIVLAVLLYLAWNASYGAHRSRIVLTLGLVALALGVLKYSVLPFVWTRTQLPHTPILDLRALGEGIKGLVALYVPTRPINQLFALGAIVAWVLAVWLQWPPEPEDDWLQRLSRGERDRLLRWLLSAGRERGRAIAEDEIRARLERPEADM